MKLKYRYIDTVITGEHSQRYIILYYINYQQTLRILAATIPAAWGFGATKIGMDHFFPGLWDAWILTGDFQGEWGLGQPDSCRKAPCPSYDR